MSRVNTASVKKSFNSILLFGAQGQLGAKLKSLLSSRGTVHALTEADLDLRDPKKLRVLSLQAKPSKKLNYRSRYFIQIHSIRMSF